jgi:hypothetical protein
MCVGVSGHVLEKVNLFVAKYTKHPRKYTVSKDDLIDTPLGVGSSRFLEGMQLRNRLQVETCLIFARNVNFEKLNFDPCKNDYKGVGKGTGCLGKVTSPELEFAINISLI